tara:strand:- start:1128 stop:1919 length:792 start_codon:yes stop_codon:yes gene_type:complete
MNKIKKQNGQSMTEFIIVFPIMIVLVFGALQFALIYQAKITLNYAAFTAARSGAVSSGHLGIMENNLAAGLAPIYTHCDKAKEVQKARDRVLKEVELGFAKIEIINPPSSAFTDFNPSNNSVNDAYIPNNNLMFREPKIGSRSGITIQDANLLKIRASYCYPMHVPVVNTLIKTLLLNKPNNCKDVYLGGQGTDNKFTAGCIGGFQSMPFENGCLINDRMPIHSTAILRMQSDAKEAAMGSGRYPGPAKAGTDLSKADKKTAC